MEQNMDNRVEIGHLDRFWDDGFKDFAYIRKPGFLEEITIWAEQGYLHTRLNHFLGSLYDNSNPMPEWVYRLDDKFGLHNQTYTFFKMETLDILPTHADHFSTYCRLNDVPREQVHRVLVMLEDWKPGHYLEIADVGYVNWKAGDWFKWEGTTPHAASNIGVDTRYTLQITGMA